MPSFTRIDIKTKLACQSGSLIGSLYPTDLLSAGDVLAIDEQERLSFSFPRTDRSGSVRSLASSIVGGLIASVVWSDNSFDEWSISTVDTRRGGSDGGVVAVTANPLMMALSDAADSSSGLGLVSTLANGLRVFAFTTDVITLDELWDTYIIPACPSWVSKGTIDFSTLIASLTWDRATPLAVAVLGRDAIRATGATAELRLRRNGTTDYKLDCVTQVGASASVPVLHARTSLQAITRTYDTSEQGTRIFTKGGSDPSGLPGIPGRARWKTGAPSGNVIALTDRNGGATPIAFDNQLVGKWLYRCKTGRTFPITAASASGGSVTLGGGVSTIAADEDVEFRYTEPLTNTLRVGAQDGGATGQRCRVITITNIAGSVFTLVNRFTGVDPISADNEMVDWYARRMSFVLASTFTSGWSGGVLSGCASTAGVQAGDILFLTSSTTPNYNFASNNGALVVDSTTANSITAHARDDNTPNYFVGAASFRVYRPVATLHRVTASVAASDTITVDAVGTAAVNDLVEFLQLDGAGEIPSYVDHPTYVQAYPTGYGVKVKDLAVERAVGVTQLVKNGWMRTWTNPAAAPDGWATSGSATLSQNTSDAFTRYGGASLKWISGAASANALITSPVFYAPYGLGTSQVSIRAYVYLSTFSVSGGADFTLTLTLYSATAAGGIGTSLGSVSVQPTDASGSVTKVGTGAWVELAVNAVTLSTGTAPTGLIAQLNTGANAVAGASTGYLDCIEAYAFAACPNTAFEFGDATILHQSANLFLANKATPIPTYEFAIADLERVDPVQWSRNALTIGGSVRVYEPDLPIDTTVRLIRYERDHLRPASSRVTLANRPALMTDYVETGINTQRKIVAVIQQDHATQTTPFVALTGATTVPTDNEIATGATSPPTVTLGTDSAVTYVPSSTTSPKTSITVGLPPSRLPTSPLL